MLLFLVTAASCGNDSRPPVVAEKEQKSFPHRDTAITPQNAYTELFLDSMLVEQFIAAEHPDTATAMDLRNFYNSRNYEYAWFANGGLSEQGVTFRNLLSSYVHLTKDSTLFDKALDAQIEHITEDSMQHTDTAMLARTDIAITRQFFIYARTAYAGRLDPADLQWFIPRRKVDALALLDSLISHKGANVDMWEPVNPMYRALKEKLAAYNDIADKGGWPLITATAKKSYKRGDSSAIITQMRKRLAAAGYLRPEDSTGRYDSSFSDAVKKAQHSFGLKETGIADKALISELNVPVKARIEQMLVNLERMRWLPEKTPQDRIVVNIPEFVIHVFENNQKAFDMNIVVGKEGTSTVVFNDQLKYIVFSPYWNVPRSIVKKEIAPAIKRNHNYIASHNMEITGYSGGLPIVRQKPGGSNSLGRVKFLFPNNYNIYFHDTPQKDLFNRDKRAFSHGCIRLADARKMAEYLLRNDTTWTSEKIDSAMNLEKEKWVPLKTPIPVFISYFTAWVDDDGVLNFRDDIYGHDKKMATQLFIQPDTTAIH
ncbi:L,D-transpeptidase family protein [Chitinophagaceae bacterium MMS25-I14]